MRVLITGNEGYIGSVMSEYLEKKGHDVEGYDVGYFSTSSVCEDVRDIEIHNLDGFDAVIYLSALSNDPLGEIKKSVTYDINWMSAVRTAYLARDAGVKRFLLASSCSMYGDGGGVEFLDEASPQNPITTYAESKVWAEKGISLLASDNFSPVFFRCGTAYGVSPNQRLDLVLNKMVADAYLYKEITVYNGGIAWRPIVHVDDISQAFNLGLIAPKNLIHNQAFNVGRNDDNFRIRDLAEAVKWFIYTYNYKVVYIGDDADNRSYKVSFDKIRDVLGFNPEWDAKKGAVQLYEHFKETELQNRVNEPFVRLERVKELMEDGSLDEDLRWN